MDDVKVLITGAGAPGIKGTIFSLKKNFDNRKIKTVGVDIKKDVVGKYLCDVLYQVPRPTEESFIPRLLEICQKEKVDVVLPQVTNELIKLASHKKDFEKIGTKIAVSNREAIELSNNKYELMKISRKLNLPTADFYLVDNFSDLEEKAGKLGWPNEPVVVKPPISNGLRGLRIINENYDRKRFFYSEKPSSVHTKMNELREVLGESFPELLVIKFLPGIEYTVDLFTGRDTMVIPRTRDMIRTGITFNGTVEKNEQIIESSTKLSKELGLEYIYGFQFMLDENKVPKIIESNPRIQGSMVMSTLAGANIIYAAVKHALGEEIPEFKIKWGTRLMRYWGGINVLNGNLIEEIV